jgi:CPA1 family monovalent cation:H+ antiporter
VGTPFLLVGGLAAILACALVAKRTNLPDPIVFVIAGVALAFVPGLPAMQLDPQYIFLIVLPPLLVNGGWKTDWRLFRTYVRPILQLAIGLVCATTVVTALVAHLLGLPWVAGFILGAIIAPPDAVAAMTIFERFRIPRRVTAVVDGEGLVNDAAALVIYQFAVAAAVTGFFSPLVAAGTFVYVAIVGVLAGLLVGLGVEGLSRLMRRFNLVDSLIDNLAFLVAPYAAYLSAVSIGASGVLAAVVGGLYIGRRSSILYGPQTRLVGGAVWDVLIYLINGFAFLAIGLQLRALFAEGGLALHAIVPGLIVAAAAIVLRIGWVFANVYLPRAIAPNWPGYAATPPWRWVAVVSWSGLRGIVSLAAALALPLHDAAGHPLVDRDVIIVMAFVVIFVTLVGQGLMLIPILRWLHLEEDVDPTDVRDIEVRVAALKAGLAALNRLEKKTEHSPDEWEIIGRIRSEYENRITHLRAHSEVGVAENPLAIFDDKLQAAALKAERAAIMRMRDEGKIPDEIFRKIEFDLDLAASRLT